MKIIRRTACLAALSAATLVSPAFAIAPETAAVELAQRSQELAWWIV